MISESSAVESETSSKAMVNIGAQHFDILRLIGEGAFGKVLLVKSRIEYGDKVYAMKVISKKVLKKKNNIAYMKSERDILTKIDHPFVVSLKFAFQSESKLFLVMEFCSGGELFFKLRKHGLIVEKDARFYMGEMILGIDFLHSKNIMHRDLKPENILLSRLGHICITDFGLAKEVGAGGCRAGNGKKTSPTDSSFSTPWTSPRNRTLSQLEDWEKSGKPPVGGADATSSKPVSRAESSPSNPLSSPDTGKQGSSAPGAGANDLIVVSPMQHLLINIDPPAAAPDLLDQQRTLCGTSEYMAPEMILRNGYGKSADWWSFGALSYEILAGNPPFKANNQKDLDRKILTEKLHLPSYLTSEAHSLFKGLLERDVNKRLGSAKSTRFKVGGIVPLKEHPFFSELSWEALGRLEIEPPLLTDTPDYRSKANNQGNAFAGFGDCPAPRAVDDTSQFDDEFTTQMVSHSMIEDTMSNASSPYRSRTNSETYKDFDYMSPDFSVSQEEINSFEEAIVIKIAKANKKRSLRNKKEEEKAIKQQKEKEAQQQLIAQKLMQEQERRKNQELEAARKVALKEQDAALRLEKLETQKYEKAVAVYGVYVDELTKLQKKLKNLKKKLRDITDMEDRKRSDPSIKFSSDQKDKMRKKGVLEEEMQELEEEITEHEEGKVEKPTLPVHLVPQAAAPVTVAPLDYVKADADATTLAAGNSIETSGGVGVSAAFTDGNTSTPAVPAASPWTRSSVPVASSSTNGAWGRAATVTQPVQAIFQCSTAKVEPPPPPHAPVSVVPSKPVVVGSPSFTVVSKKKR